MGKLNRKINSKIGKEKKLQLSQKGLSNILLGKKATVDQLTSETVSVVKNFKSPVKEKPTENFTDFVTNRNTKKFIKNQFETANKSKISKKEKMKIRKNTLATKLAGEATKKKEVKAKKVREKTVIVKDIKPLLDDLLEIEEDIKKDDLHKVKKDQIDKKRRPYKPTLKEKRRQEQFLKDLAFMKEANAHPAYMKTA